MPNYIFYPFIFVVFVAVLIIALPYATVVVGLQEYRRWRDDVH